MATTPTPPPTAAPPTATQPQPQAAGTAASTPPAPAVPLDKDTFSFVTARAGEIAVLLSARHPIAAQLGNQLLGQLQDFVDQTWPSQSQKRKAGIVAAQQRQLDTYHQLWQQIHARPFSWTPGNNDDVFLDSMQKQLPGCQTCRKGMASYRTKNLPGYTSLLSYFTWTVAFHNSINAAKGKPIVTVAAAWVQYAPTGLAMPAA